MNSVQCTKTGCADNAASVRRPFLLRQRVLRRFATFCFGEEPADLNTITRDDIVAYLDSASPTTGRSDLTYRATGLRSLFGFLFATGRFQQDLALRVPRIAQPQSETLRSCCKPVFAIVDGHCGTKVAGTELLMQETLDEFSRFPICYRFWRAVPRPCRSR